MNDCSYSFLPSINVNLNFIEMSPKVSFSLSLSNSLFFSSLTKKKKKSTTAVQAEQQL